MWRKRWPWACGVAVLLIGITLVGFPARWVWPWLAGDYPQVRLTGLHGSVWQGRAERLRVSGIKLGALRWHLSPTALWGNLRADFKLEGPAVMADGHIRRADDGSIVLEDGRFRVRMRRLPIGWPGREPPAGVLSGTLHTAQLVHGWPARLELDMVWRNAQLVLHARHWSLGDFGAHWRARPDGVLVAQLADRDKGPLALRGQLRLTPAGASLDALLRVRGQHPVLRQALETWGTPQADGGVRVHRQTGMQIEEWMQ